MWKLAARQRVYGLGVVFVRGGVAYQSNRPVRCRASDLEALGVPGARLFTQTLFKLLDGVDQRLQHVSRLVAGDQQGAGGPFLAIWTRSDAIDA